MRTTRGPALTLARITRTSRGAALALRRILRASRGAALALGLVLVAVGGCAGASGGAASPTPTKANADQLVAFARCMRGQGVHLPDPKPGQSLKDIAAPIARSNYPAFRRAASKCQTELPAGLATKTANPDQMLRWTRCMRDHGVQIADPKPGSAPDLGHVDTKSPRFSAAVKACGALLGRGRTS